MLIAFGVVIAQFRAYCDVSAELVTARARLGLVDTPAAKRAYLDDCIRGARALIEDVTAHAQGADWYAQGARIFADLNNWETDVRAELGKAWGHEEVRRFDAHAQTDQADRFTRHDPPSAVQEYIERRIKRLEELRDETH